MTDFGVQIHMAFLDILTGHKIKASRFERQIRPHLDALYRYAYRLSGNQYDAEDIIQELLISLFDKDINLKKLDSPQTWLLKSLYHKFIDFTRKQARNPSQPGELIPELILDQLANPYDEINIETEKQHINHQLEIAMQQLNPEQRAVVTLHDIEGFPLAELSQMLDTPIGTLKSRLHRARAELKKSIKKEPFTPTQRVTG